METSGNDKEKLVTSWLSGELSDEEQRAFEASPEFKTYKAIMDEASQWQLPNMDLESSYQKMLSLRDGSQKRQKTIFFNPGNFMVRIAASLLLVAGIYFAYQYAQGTAVVVVTTAAKEQKQVTLPNGSTVTLNASSEIAYNTKDWADSREISLKGNAFFDVTAGKPFTVDMETGTVAVKGTSFDIVSTPQYLSVACYEGKVEVGDKASNEKYGLEMGDLVRFGKGTESEKLKFDASEAPSWMTGVSKFENAPLREVIYALETQFGIKIEAAKVDVKRKITCEFSHDDVDLALKIVFAPLNISYERLDDRIILR